MTDPHPPAPHAGGPPPPGLPVPHIMHTAEVVTLTREHLQQIVTEAAREAARESATAGASEALRRVGLDDQQAMRDMIAMRELLQSWRDVRRTIGRGIVSTLTTALIGAILTYLWLSGIRPPGLPPP